MALNVAGLEGNENSDYDRTAPTRGRWGDTWDVFKSSFGKIVLINLFVLLFFVPGIVVVFFRSAWINALGATYPFNANTGVGYPAYPDTQGLTESIYFSADLLFFSILIVAGFIASVGIAGGAYSIRKLLQTHGEFKIKGFFHGVKVCYLNTVIPVTLFMVFLFATTLVGDWKDMVIARGGSGVGPITAYVFIIIATVLVGIYAAWMLAVGVGYKLKFLQLLKNSFVFIIATPIHTVFFAGLALMPLWIYMIGWAASFFKIIAYIIFIFMGFSYILLVWLSFTQWTFDLFVTPNIKAEDKKSQAVAQKEAVDPQAATRELLASGKSELIGKPMLPIQKDSNVQRLGKTFNRGDVEMAAKQREKLKQDVLNYENEHKNDPEYAEYNKLFADREKALQSDTKKGKKKKVSSDNLLK